MGPSRGIRRAGLVLALCGALAACNSSEERAERFFQSGLELREAGDLDRAIVEFRNVFQYDGEHLGARRNLAEVLLEKGDMSGAYSQYLRLAEQYPDDLDVRARLATLAVEARQWEEAERHGRPLIEAEPDSRRARIVAAALAYRQAEMGDDDPGRAAAAAEARALLEEDPDEIIPRQIAIAQALSEDDAEAALADLDAAMAVRPEVLDYALLKLRVLTERQDVPAIEAHLQEMRARFPGNAQVQQTLAAWYVSRGDTDQALSVMRDMAGPETGVPDAHLPVIRFLQQARGREGALAEIERLIAANDAAAAQDVEGAAGNAAYWRTLKASYAFEEGEAERAVAELRAVLADAPEGQTLRVKGILAEMLRLTGDAEGARALVEEVLAEDAANVGALKVRGALLIDADQPDEAIVDLRRALDQAPRDTDTILLLAEAHQRAGDLELMGERLAAAVQVSDSAPREALRYAAYLTAQGRTAAARSVLADARTANPRNVDVMLQEARLALREGATATVRRTAAELQRMGEDDPRAAEAAEALQTALLLRENRRDEGLALLEERAGTAGEDAQAALAVIRARIQAGEVEEARDYLDGLRANAPGDQRLALMDAALTLAEGDAGAAEAMLREVAASDGPEAVEAARLLSEQLRAQGRRDEAVAVVEEALAAAPRARPLRLLRAADLERDGDIEGAIAIYEALYDENSGDVVVANNLASLLATHREDEASLARAAAVAQRLRALEVPPFQDTYGWIAYRRGEVDEAVRYLEPAAAGLPQDPLVQYHLGAAYRAVGRDAEAAEALAGALALAGDSDLPQFDAARAALAEICAGGTESPACGTSDAATSEEEEAPDAGDAATGSGDGN